MARAMLLLILVLVCVQQVTSGIPGISVNKRNADKDCPQGIIDDCAKKGCSYLPNGIESCVCYCPGDINKGK